MDRQWLIEEFRALSLSILRVAGFFVLAAALIFSVPVRGHSVAESAITHIRDDFLPPGVSLVARTPLDPFLAQAVIAAELALLLTAPLAAWELWHWLSPALYRRERRLLAGFLISSFALVALGAAFTYSFVLPALFRGLYGFLPPGVEPLFDLRAVADMVAGMLFFSSIVFLLPVAMAMLSGIGLVRPRFWLTYARHAILLGLIVSAIITPDGTGITMMLLALPIAGLYALGYLGARALWRSRRGREAGEAFTHLISD
jgi:sec-independent protein translocase protein TatC